MKIAISQLNSGSDWSENEKRLIECIRKAAEASAQCIVFPENALYMGPRNRLLSLGQKHFSALQNTLVHLAKEHRLAILLGGVPEPIPTLPKVFNTALFIDETGKILGKYRKRHLFDVKTPEGRRFRESKEMEAGKRRVQFNWNGFTIGLHICYDLRFPEDFRAQARRGGNLFLVPAAFTYETGKAHWKSLIRARAIENLSYVVAPGQTGKHPGNNHTFGHSLVVDPWGTVLAEAGNRPTLLYAELDAMLSRQYRKRFPAC